MYIYMYPRMAHSGRTHKGPGGPQGFRGPHKGAGKPTRHREAHKGPGGPTRAVRTASGCLSIPSTKEMRNAQTYTYIY